GYDQKTCTVHETTLVFAKKPEGENDEFSYLATVTSHEIGRATTTYKLRKISASAGKRITAAAEFVSGSIEGSLSFQNTTEDDIHTWVLSCPVEFTLTDIYGVVYLPQQRNGNYLHRFLTPASIHGSIAKDATVR